MIRQPKNCTRFSGAHTFFVGDEGLHIVEEIEPLREETGAREIIRLASWRDDQRSTLEVHEPELIGTVVVTATNGQGKPARTNARPIHGHPLPVTDKHPGEPGFAPNRPPTSGR